MSKLPIRVTPERRKHPLLQFIQDWLPIATVAAGAAWTVYDYSAKRVEAEKIAETTRRIEAQRPFLTKKLDLYFETAKTTGQLLNLAPGTDAWKQQAARFWSLRWSEMEMVGNLRVREAMRRVGEQIITIQTVDDETTRQNLRWMTECLADELRYSLERSWGSSAIGDPIQAVHEDLPGGCVAGRTAPKWPSAEQGKKS